MAFILERTGSGDLYINPETGEFLLTGGSPLTNLNSKFPQTGNFADSKNLEELTDRIDQRRLFLVGDASGNINFANPQFPNADFGGPSRAEFNLRRQYNNPLPEEDRLNEEEFRDFYNTQIKRDVNILRANVLNNLTTNSKRQEFFDNGIKFVIDPRTGNYLDGDGQVSKEDIFISGDGRLTNDNNRNVPDENRKIENFKNIIPPENASQKVTSNVGRVRVYNAAALRVQEGISLISAKTSKGSNSNNTKIQIQANPNRPTDPPIINDANGFKIAEWNPETHTWVAEPGATVLPGNKSSSPLAALFNNFTQESDGPNFSPVGTVFGRQVASGGAISANQFLNINNELLISETARIINSFPPQDRKAFVTSQTFTKGINVDFPTEENFTLTAQPDPLGSPNTPINRSGVGLRYPEDLSGDFIQFTIQGYGGGKVRDESDVRLNTQVVNNKRVISLPIQSGITDSNSTNWKTDKLNPFKAAAASQALDLLGQEGELQSGQRLLDAIRKLKSGSENSEGKDELTRGLAIAAAEQATGSNLRSRFSGEVMNPNLELLFNGPELRTFQFNFILTARDAKEAVTIKDIINEFKRAMAPKEQGSLLFLKSPDIFKIEYKTSDGVLHPSINRFKRCALQQFSVDYTPAGTYSTFNDTQFTMTQYKLTMGFGELDPIYEKDQIGHPIGF